MMCRLQIHLVRQENYAFDSKLPFAIKNLRHISFKTSGTRSGDER